MYHADRRWSLKEKAGVKLRTLSEEEKRVESERRLEKIEK